MSFLPDDLQDLIDQDNARLSNFDDRLVEQACRLVQHLATFDIPTTLSVSSSGLSVSVPSDAIGQLEASMGDVELYEVPDPPNYVHQGYKLYRLTVGTKPKSSWMTGRNERPRCG